MNKNYFNYFCLLMYRVMTSVGFLLFNFAAIIKLESLKRICKWLCLLPTCCLQASDSAVHVFAFNICLKVPCLPVRTYTCLSIKRESNGVVMIWFECNTAFHCVLPRRWRYATTWPTVHLVGGAVGGAIGVSLSMRP